MCTHCDETPPIPIYTLSLHDALPIYLDCYSRKRFKKIPYFEIRYIHSNFTWFRNWTKLFWTNLYNSHIIASRSEEHTSELQSRGHLVCRLLLEKKNNI